MNNRSVAKFLESVVNGDLVTCKKYFQKYEPFTWYDIRDEFGCTALHLAATNGYGHIVNFLLQSALIVKSQNKNIIDDCDEAGRTPLQRAASNGHETVVRTLIKYGANLNLQDKCHGNSALHEAAWKGYSFTVIQLIAAGSNLTLTNSMGFTALHLCCQNGHNQTCRELLLAGVDPNLSNNYGDTALHTAARYGHAGVMRILISAQCNVSLKNENGDTALHIASAMGRRKLTRIILEANCDKTIINKQHETAKDIAIRKHFNDIVNLIDSIKIKNLQKHKLPKNRKTQKEPKMPLTSPYGCTIDHSSETDLVPEPKLNSLPQEPLKKGEQYYLDLAGNIHKGPIGIGYPCYCAPIINHIENKLTKNKEDIKKHLDSQVLNLEHKLVHDSAIERARCDQKYRQIESKLLKIASTSKRYKKSKSGPISIKSKSLDILTQKAESDIGAENSKNDQVEEISQNEKIDFKSDTLRSASNAAQVTVEVTKRRSVAEIVAQLQKNREITTSEIDKWRTSMSPKSDSSSEELESIDDELKEPKNNLKSIENNDKIENALLNVQTSLSISNARSRNTIYDNVNLKTATLLNTKTNTNQSFERDNNNDSGYSKGNSPSLSSGQLELFDAKHHNMAFGSSSLV